MIGIVFQKVARPDRGHNLIQRDRLGEHLLLCVLCHAEHPTGYLGTNPCDRRHRRLLLVLSHSSSIPVGPLAPGAASAVLYITVTEICSDN